MAQNGAVITARSPWRRTVQFVACPPALPRWTTGRLCNRACFDPSAERLQRVRREGREAATRRLTSSVWRVSAKALNASASSTSLAAWTSTGQARVTACPPPQPHTTVAAVSEVGCSKVLDGARHELGAVRVDIRALVQPADVDAASARREGCRAAIARRMPTAPPMIMASPKLPLVLGMRATVGHRRSGQPAVAPGAVDVDAQTIGTTCLAWSRPEWVNSPGLMVNNVRVWSAITASWPSRFPVSADNPEGCRSRATDHGRCIGCDGSPSEQSVGARVPAPMPRSASSVRVAGHRNHPVRRRRCARQRFPGLLQRMSFVSGGIDAVEAGRFTCTCRPARCRCPQPPSHLHRCLPGPAAPRSRSREGQRRASLAAGGEASPFDQHMRARVPQRIASMARDLATSCRGHQRVEGWTVIRSAGSGMSAPEVSSGSPHGGSFDDCALLTDHVLSIGAPLPVLRGDRHVQALCHCRRAAVAVAGTAHAQQFFRIGTGGTAGTYYPVGGMIANAVSQPGKIVVTAQASNGSVANVTGIAGGAIEPGSRRPTWPAGLHGQRHLPTKASPIVPGLRLIANLYPESVHLVVRKGLGVKSVADLKGQARGPGRAWLGHPGECPIILSAYGLKESDLKPEYIQAQPGRRQAQGRRAGCVLFVGGAPAGAIAELASSGAGIEIVSIDGPQADAIPKDGSSRPT